MHNAAQRRLHSSSPQLIERENVEHLLQENDKNMNQTWTKQKRKTQQPSQEGIQDACQTSEKTFCN